MSQAGEIDVVQNHPEILTEVVANSGFAIPIANTMNIFAATVLAGSIPARTVASGNTVTTQIQISQAIAASDVTKIGLAAFYTPEFAVDSNGLVTLGPSIPTSFIGNTGVATPVLNQLTVIGSVVAAGTTPITVLASGSTLNAKIQISQAIASTSATKIGLCAFDSTRFTVDANGFVSFSGTGVSETLTGDSGGAVTPTANNINVIGGTVAAGTSPVKTAGSGSTLTVNVQTSQAIASTDATKIGLASFDSARFTVDANGFVSLASTGAGETITGDSGGALTPSAGDWNIVGLSGVTTSGSGSTLTIKGPPFSDKSASATSVKNTGEFVTGAYTRTLPASAGLADGDLFTYVCTSASALIIQAVGAQKIRLGNAITSAAGTLTSTAIGDSITLRFRATDGFFYTVSAQGNWTPA